MRCDHAPMEPIEFADLPLDPALFQGLDALGHVRMTPIQAQSLPPLLEGRDVIAQAPTGSGKTAAFGLALLHGSIRRTIRLQALVLCPTRELADQVSKEIRRLATRHRQPQAADAVAAACRWVRSSRRWRMAPHVVVGTPGRVQELLEQAGAGPARRAHAGARRSRPHARHGLRRGDPTDHRAQRRRSGRRCCSRRPIPMAIRELARAMHARSGRGHGRGARRAGAAIEQRFYEVDADEQARRARRPAAGALRPASSAGVLQHAARCRRLSPRRCAHAGFSALALHGDMEQRDRDEVLVRFANRSCTRAGRHRRRRARARHRGARRGDQLRTAHRSRRLRAPHRPHRPRRPQAGWR